MQLNFRTLFLLSAPLAVWAQLAPPKNWTRPNDKSLDGIKLSDYDCGDACKTFVQAGIDSDRSTIYGEVPFDEDFYATSKKFSPKTSKPGDLLKKQAYVNSTTDWLLPMGATLYRIQYVSVGQDNKVVPATAFVVLPFAKRIDKKPFSVVAFAHGTIGTFYGCAPSTSFNLYDYQTWEQLYLSGYAVVGTDYAGLGNNYTSHHYLANTLEANDVYYSVIAAKKAFGKLLGTKWASTGHSQGGGAVWGLVESDLVTYKAPCNRETPLEFVGGVSISPATRIADFGKFFGAENATEALCGYAPFIYEALEASKPGSAAGLLTPTMMKRIALGQKIGACFEAGGLLGADLCEADGLAGVYNDVSALTKGSPALDAFQKMYGSGLGKQAQAPMLVVQSTGDHTVPYNVTVTAAKTTCKAGGGYPVELSLYPVIDHSTTPGASSPEWLDWLRGRFEGKPHARHCEIRDYDAVDADAAFAPSG